MQIEIGKYYINRRDEIVGPMVHHPDSLYKWTDGKNNYTDKGEHYYNLPNQFDLIAEHNVE